MPLLPPEAVLIDLEGTATPREFVAGVLRPYSVAQRETFLRDHAADADVAAVLADAARAVPAQDPHETLAHWAAHDTMMAPWQALQALIWRDGFQRGALADVLFPDVVPALRRWSKGGLRLATYSADAASLHRLLFAHAPEGDTSGLFQGFFDTRVGRKSEPESFGRLAIALGVPTVEVAYLSADEAELDAAAVAGMRTCQILRDGAAPSERHPVAAEFSAAATILGLPGGL